MVIPEPEEPRPAGTPRDLRGRLPTMEPRPEWRIRAYPTRPLDYVEGVTLHYTAGPVNQTVADIAAHQISANAIRQTGVGQPFPAIAYHLMVTQDGTVHLCHDLDVRVWHSAALVNGRKRNETHVGICYTGNREPNPEQIRGLAEAIRWCQDQLGRRLTIEGHRDAPYATDCPGPGWPGWHAALDQALGLTSEPTDQFQVRPGFREFLKQHPEWGKPRMDEQLMVGGAYLWTTPTAQHPKGGLLVYREWLNEVRPLGWD